MLFLCSAVCHCVYIHTHVLFESFYFRESTQIFADEFHLNLRIQIKKKSVKMSYFLKGEGLNSEILSSSVFVKFNL